MDDGVRLADRARRGGRDARYRVTVAGGFSDRRAVGTVRHRLAYPHGPEVVADAGLTRDWDRDELPIRVILAVTESAGPAFDRTWELPVPRDLLCPRAGPRTRTMGADG